MKRIASIPLSPQDSLRIRSTAISIRAKAGERSSFNSKKTEKAFKFRRRKKGPSVPGSISIAASARVASHPLSYPWHDDVGFVVLADERHPHTSVPEPPAKAFSSEENVARGESAGSTYRDIAKDYGELRPGERPNLKHYDYRTFEPQIDSVMQQSGYSPYFAGGKYGKPDLERRNYNTGHVMVYDPESGGEPGAEEYTRTWRKIHELSHALTYEQLNDKYGEGRRIGKLGWHRTLREAKRAVEWEWLAAHKQRELSTKIGHPIDDETFAREVNVVMHDAVHRAITGKFTNPDEEGFTPSSKLVPLQVSLGKLEATARAMGLNDENALLTPQQKQLLSRSGLAKSADLGQRELEEYMSEPRQFAIVSAYKDTLSKKANQERHAQLLTEVRNRGYVNTQTHVLRGQYFSDVRDDEGNVVMENGAPKRVLRAEQSVLVLDMTLDDVLALGERFEQESVIFKADSGTIAAYYTDGSGRANPALDQSGAPAVGVAAGAIKPRAPKPKRRGPPSPEDLWSKARNVGFSFNIDWGTTLHHDGRALTPEQMTEQLRASRPSAPSAPTTTGQQMNEETRHEDAPISVGVGDREAITIRNVRATALPSTVPHTQPVQTSQAPASEPTMTGPGSYIETEEHGPFEQPIPVAEWPGVPEWAHYDEHTNQLIDSRTGLPLDPKQFGLSKQRPYEPATKGNEGRELWTERLRDQLTPYQQTRLERMRQQEQLNARLKSDRKQWTNEREKLLDKKQSEGLSAKEQAQLDEVEGNLQLFPTPEEESSLYSAKRTTPTPSSMKLEDLKVTPSGGVKNILRVLEAARPDEIEYWKNWYEHARTDAHALATKYKVPDALSAALIAVLSPNVKWEENVRAAEQMLRGRGQKVIEYRRRLEEKAQRDLFARLFPELFESKETLGTFGYLRNITKAQRIIDTHKATGSFPEQLLYNVYLRWDPEDEKDVHVAQKMFSAAKDKGYSARAVKPGAMSKTTGRPLATWNPGDEVTSFKPHAFGARYIMEPPVGDPEEGAPKVSAFYESIMSPETAQRKVVLDGHAINIWRGRPETLARMKTVNDKEKNQMRDDYKEASRLSGPILASKGLRGELSPQQVQAVTWSVWRAAIGDVDMGGEDDDDMGDRSAGVRVRVRAIEETPIIVCAIEANIEECISITASADGLALRRSGYQRYTGDCNDHKVWIGGDSVVSHGSFPGGRRQRRETVWKVKVDGDEVGEAKSLKEARALAIERCGGEVPTPDELSDVPVSDDMAPVVTSTPGAPSSPVATNPFGPSKRVVEYDFEPDMSVTAATYPGTDTTGEDHHIRATDIHAGDRVRFNDDFEVDFGDEGTARIARDTIAEVIDSQPQAPFLTVRAEMCVENASASRSRSGSIDVDVRPTEVTLVLDPEDPRTN